MFRSFFVFFTTLAIASSAGIAQACMGVEGESRTFMTALPPHATEKAIVAGVVITSSTIDTDSMIRYSDVRVVKPVKGVKAEQRLRVASQTHSCAPDATPDMGQIYFIAGDVDDKGVFQGNWNYEALTKK